MDYKGPLPPTHPSNPYSVACADWNQIPFQVFSRLVSDLINTIKQKSATFLDGARVNYKDLILVPEYIFDETSHAADVTRNVLVLDNLEEKQYFASTSGTK